MMDQEEYFWRKRRKPGMPAKPPALKEGLREKSKKVGKKMKIGSVERF
jgi:hypothetical protein